MVIGIFTDTFYPEISGVTTSVLMLKRELEKIGHSVYVFTCSNPEITPENDIPNTFRLPSAPFIFLPSRRFAVVYQKNLAHKIAELNLDIIHTNTEFSLGFFGKLIAASLNKPVVHTYHTLYKDYVHYITKGHFENFSAEMARKYSRMFCNNCCSLVTPTDKTRDLLLEYEIERPIEVIPTGIDLDHFKYSPGDAEKIAALKKGLGIKSGEKIILNAGRIAKEKSIDVVMRQLPGYFAKHRNVKFVIAGDGPAKQEISALANELRISDKVIFAGERPWSEIHLFYKMASVFVSASLSETQGLTFIEAMASGTPVLARKDRSVEKIIFDGYSGSLFDDVREIPGKLEKITSDDAFRDSLVSRAHDIAEQYSSRAFAYKIESLYDRILMEWDRLDKKYILSNKIIQKILL